MVDPLATLLEIYSVMSEIKSSIIGAVSVLEDAAVVTCVAVLPGVAVTSAFVIKLGMIPINLFR